MNSGHKLNAESGRLADLERVDSSTLSAGGTCPAPPGDQSPGKKAATSRRTPESAWRATVAGDAALTLLEMMVSVTLLVVIMVGLLLMFNQTQKALLIANSQTDVFEAARGSMQLVTRDLTEMYAWNAATNITNVYATRNAKYFGIGLPLAGGGTLNTVFHDVFWMTHVNDEWRGIGYFLEGADFGVGALYRVSEPVRQDRVPFLFTTVSTSTNARLVADGVVHFTVQAVYATNTGTATEPIVLFERSDILKPFTFPTFINELVPGVGANPPTTRTITMPLPAFVDLDIGVLEPATLKQYRSLTNTMDQGITDKFLSDHVGKVHFFRERVPIRNFINPYRSNEVP